MAELSAQPRPARSRDVQGRSTRSARGPQRKGEHEQATAAGLDLLRVLGWLVLHDVTIPADPANGVAEIAVDHVLAGPPGVYVVNTVSWSGPITAADGVLTVGKTDHSDVLAEAAAAADVVRMLLGGTPVAPLLCFERLEAVAGVAGDVALCASENILDLLTSQPQILDDAAVGKASARLAAACRALRGAPAVAPKSPARDHPTPRPVVGPTVEELARARAEQLAAQAAADAAVHPAELVDEPERHERHERHGLARAFRRTRRSAEVVDQVIDPVVDQVIDPVADLPVVEPRIVPEPGATAVEPTGAEVVERGTDAELAEADASTVTRLPNAAVAEAGAALWRTLTESVHHHDGAHQDDVIAASTVDPAVGAPTAGERVTPEPGLGPVDELDVEAAFAEAEARQREAEEHEAAVGAGPAAAATAAGEVSRPLEHDPELEAQLQAARQAHEARARAVQELLEEARREAEEAEARELAERERAEAEERARLEAEERARLEAEAREREERERAEAEERARLEAEEREREQRERAEAEERARLEAEEREREQRERQAREQAEREERERAEAEERARLEAEARERAERERAEAEERARLEAEARERERAEREERERAEHEERERAEAEERARLEAEARKREERERQAREQAEREERERAEAEERARLEAEAREREERERQAREQAEREERERAEAEERARLEAEARERAEREQAERERAEAEERRRLEEEARAEQERRREEEAQEAAARAAWEARLRTAREAREREAHEGVAVPDPGDQGVMAVLRAHQPDVRQAELLLPEPVVAAGVGVAPAEPPAGEPPAADVAADEPVEPAAELDLDTWEPALDDTWQPDVVDDEPQAEETQWEAQAAVVVPRMRKSTRVADDDVVDAPIADPRLDAPTEKLPHGLRPSWSRRRRRRAVEAEDGASQGRRFPGRAIAHVALGALLIAGVIVGAPRAHDVVSWAQQLVGGSDGTAVGTLVDVAADTEHPAVQVLAGAPVDVPPAVAAAGKGKHLVVVPLRLHNQGAEPWQVPVAARATVMDDLGITHPVAKAVRAVKGYPLLPGRAAVAPGQDTKGYVAFAVPDGRTVTSVTLGLSQSGKGAVTWQVRP